MAPVLLSHLEPSRTEEIEDWPWLDKAVLRPSRSRQVCMTCHFFRHHPGPECIPLLTCQLHQGLIASGDQFVSTARSAALIRSALRGAGMEPLALEMEGAAVAQVCHDYGIPFAAVRTISDRSDEDSPTDFQHFVTHVASQHARAIIGQLMHLLPGA